MTIEELQKKLNDQSKVITQLKKENIDLKESLKELQDLNDAQLRNLNNLLEEAREEIRNSEDRNLNNLTSEAEAKGGKEEWEKIIDEMAHSINNDVYLAVSKLSRIKNDERVQSAKYHVNKIRDLVNLIMLYLKRNEVPFSNEYSILDINNILADEIAGIEESLNTLRISSREHLKNLESLKTTFTPIENSSLSINKELESTIGLILKDIIRNAYKNTNEENPKVSVSLISSDNFVDVIITNNILIPDDFVAWMNETSDIEPEISKSMKVGLRVVKKWSDLLKINIVLKKLVDINSTEVTLRIPREIRYDQKL